MGCEHFIAEHSCRICFRRGIAASAADFDIDKTAGVYKKTFQNANIDGDKYKSEDILEIVKLTPMLASTWSISTGTSAISGSSRASKAILVYRGPDNVLGKKCFLSVRMDRQN